MERFAIKIDKTLRANLYKICRLCGIDNPDKVKVLDDESIVNLEDGEPELWKKVLDCIGLLITKDDKMPQFMCTLCVDKINDFFEFREMCYATDGQTRKLLGIKDEPKLKIPTRASTSSVDCKAEDQDIKEPVPAPVVPAQRTSRKRRNADMEICNTLKGIKTDEVDDVKPAAANTSTSVSKKKRLKLDNIETDTKPAADIKPGPSSKLGSSSKIGPASKMGPASKVGLIGKLGPAKLGLSKKRLKIEPTTKDKKDIKPAKMVKRNLKVETPPPVVVQEERKPLSLKIQKKKKSLELLKQRKLAKKVAVVKVEKLRKGSVESKIKEETPVPGPAPAPTQPKVRLKDKCAICSEGFLNKALLDKHIRSTHIPTIARYHCVQCNETLKKNMEIKNHNLWHKLSKTPFQCGNCAESSCSIYTYSKHIRDCGQVAYLDTHIPDWHCPDCSKVFETTYLFNIHSCVSNTLVCPGCDRSLKWKEDYFKHIPTCSAAVHRIPPYMSSVIQVKNEAEHPTSPIPQPNTLPLPSTSSTIAQPTPPSRITPPLMDSNQCVVIPGNVNLLEEETSPSSKIGGRRSKRITKKDLKRFDKLLKSTMTTLVSIKHEPSQDEPAGDDDEKSTSSDVRAASASPPVSPGPANEDFHHNDDDSTDEETSAQAVGTIKQEIIDEGYRDLYNNIEVNIKREVVLNENRNVVVSSPEKMVEDATEAPKPAEPIVPKPVLKLKITKEHGTLNSVLLDSPKSEKKKKRKKRREEKLKAAETEEANAIQEGATDVSDIREETAGASEVPEVSKVQDVTGSVEEEPAMPMPGIICIKKELIEPAEAEIKEIAESPSNLSSNSTPSIVAATSGSLQISCVSQGVHFNGGEDADEIVEPMQENEEQGEALEAPATFEEPPEEIDIKPRLEDLIPMLLIASVSSGEELVQKPVKTIAKRKRRQPTVMSKPSTSTPQIVSVSSGIEVVAYPPKPEKSSTDDEEPCEKVDSNKNVFDYSQVKVKEEIVDPTYDNQEVEEEAEKESHEEKKGRDEEENEGDEEENEGDEEEKEGDEEDKELDKEEKKADEEETEEVKGDVDDETESTITDKEAEETAYIANIDFDNITIKQEKEYIDDGLDNVGDDDTSDTGTESSSDTEDNDSESEREYQELPSDDDENLSETPAVPDLAPLGLQIAAVHSEFISLQSQPDEKTESQLGAQWNSEGKIKPIPTVECENLKMIVQDDEAKVVRVDEQMETRVVEVKEAQFSDKMKTSLLQEEFSSCPLEEKDTKETCVDDKMESSVDEENEAHIYDKLETNPVEEKKEKEEHVDDKIQVSPVENMETEEVSGNLIPQTLANSEEILKIPMEVDAEAESLHLSSSETRLDESPPVVTKELPSKRHLQSCLSEATIQSTAAANTSETEAKIDECLSSMATSEVPTLSIETNHGVVVNKFENKELSTISGDILASNTQANPLPANEFDWSCNMETNQSLTSTIADELKPQACTTLQAVDERITSDIKPRVIEINYDQVEATSSTNLTPVSCTTLQAVDERITSNIKPNVIEINYDQVEATSSTTLTPDISKADIEPAVLRNELLADIQTSTISDDIMCSSSTILQGVDLLKGESESKTFDLSSSITETCNEDQSCVLIPDAPGADTETSNNFIADVPTTTITKDIGLSSVESESISCSILASSHSARETDKGASMITPDSGDNTPPNIPTIQPVNTPVTSYHQSSDDISKLVDVNPASASIMGSIYSAIAAEITQDEGDINRSMSDISYCRVSEDDDDVEMIPVDANYSSNNITELLNQVPSVAATQCENIAQNANSTLSYATTIADSTDNRLIDQVPPSSIAQCDDDVTMRNIEPAVSAIDRLIEHASSPPMTQHMGSEAETMVLSFATPVAATLELIASPAMTQHVGSEAESMELSFPTPVTGTLDLAPSTITEVIDENMSGGSGSSLLSGFQATVADTNYEPVQSSIPQYLSDIATVDAEKAVLLLQTSVQSLIDSQLPCSSIYSIADQETGKSADNHEVQANNSNDGNQSNLNDRVPQRISTPSEVPESMDVLSDLTVHNVLQDTTQNSVVQTGTLGTPSTSHQSISDMTMPSVLQCNLRNNEFGPLSTSSMSLESSSHQVASDVTMPDVLQVTTDNEVIPGNLDPHSISSLTLESTSHQVISQATVANVLQGTTQNNEEQPGTLGPHSTSSMTSESTCHQVKSDLNIQNVHNNVVYPGSLCPPSTSSIILESTSHQVLSDLNMPTVLQGTTYNNAVYLGTLNPHSNSSITLEPTSHHVVSDLNIPSVLQGSTHNNAVYPGMLSPHSTPSIRLESTSHHVISNLTMPNVPQGTTQNKDIISVTEEPLSTRSISLESTSHHVDPNTNTIPNTSEISISIDFRGVLSNSTLQIPMTIVATEPSNEFHRTSHVIRETVPTNLPTYSTELQRYTSEPCYVDANLSFTELCRSTTATTLANLTDFHTLLTTTTTNVHPPQIGQLLSNSLPSDTDLNVPTLSEEVQNLLNEDTVATNNFEHNDSILRARCSASTSAYSPSAPVAVAVPNFTDLENINEIAENNNNANIERELQDELGNVLAAAIADRSPNDEVDENNVMNENRANFDII